MLFLQGLILGASIAAPVGPIGVLCIRRTLSNGRWSGFLSGMGAATADMVYGAVAAFGLSALTNLLLGQANWLRLLGGIFLLYLGAQTFRAKPAEQAAQANEGGLLMDYFSTFLLTITNPMTILAFLALFGGLTRPGSVESTLELVAGVFAGSACWWMALSFGVGLMRERFGPPQMIWLNRISGAIIFTFGFHSLLQL